jgi:drug/metabolite transporter (DMT)-like permease
VAKKHLTLQNKQPNGKAYLALTATSILWGTSWVASKIAISEIPALQLTYIRQFLAGTIFLSYFLFIKKSPLPTVKDFKSIVVMAALMFLSANGLSTWGLKYIPTGLASLIGALYPLSVVLIEWVFYKKKDVSVLTFVGLLIGIGGVGFVFYENMFTHVDPNLFFGLMLSIIAMLSWSLGTVFLSRHHLSVDPYFGMGWQMMIGSAMLFVFAHIAQDPIPLATISIKSWLSISYLVVIGSVISFIAFIYSLKRLPVAISSLYAYINPIVAMIIAAILLKEKLTISIVIGTIITLIGVYLVNYSVRREKEDMITEAEI